MEKLSRRQALSQLAVGGAGLALTNAVAAQQPTPTPVVAAVAPGRAFAGKHTPKPLPFDPAKLNGLSEKLVKSHWENNYGGAVNALNAVETRLNAMRGQADVPGFIYADLKREELLRTGSIVLHDHYFGNLGGDGKPGGKVLDLLKEWFGSVEAWQAEFMKTAQGLAGGSGWVILAYNEYTREIHNYWAWDHMHHAAFTRPLLVLDMYEHAYHIDFGAAAAKYIAAFMQNVNWEEVNRRAEAALKAA